MMTTPQQAGTSCLRWLILALAFLLTNGFSAPAQVVPKPDVNRLYQYRDGKASASDPSAKELFEQFGRYYVSRLMDSDVQRDGMSALRKDFNRYLLVPPQYSYSKLNAAQKQFVDEYGKAMIAALQEPVLKSTNPIVRVNAALMVAEVCRSGYDGAAALCIEVLKNPEETDGFREASRHYILEGLYHLFAIVPDPKEPERTVFRKKDLFPPPELERNSIQALIDYIMHKPITDPNIPPEAQQYVRREAIRALGQVRAQAVMSAPNRVESRPAWVLLRAAQGDGLTPPPSTSERAEAIIGFCQLIPDRDRDLQLDYAVYYIGWAILKFAEPKVNNPNDQSVPWKTLAAHLREALNTWRGRAANLNLANANRIQDLIGVVDAHVLRPLEAVPAQPLNLPELHAWLTNHPPSSPSLFKSDPSTTVTPPQ